PTLELFAFADDVCILLSNQNGPSRTRLHMQQYILVSNDKFNIDKIEAFWLNDKLDRFWKSILTDHNISTYYHTGSVQAFRYLGSYLPCCTRHRRLLE
ncbi:hypothetical protein BDF21DRAFT_324200, partial [Thamnidium elegans]